jgi:hypothetical protein
MNSSSSVSSRNDNAALGKAYARSGSSRLSYVRLLLKYPALRPKKLSGTIEPTLESS